MSPKASASSVLLLGLVYEAPAASMSANASASSMLSLDFTLTCAVVSAVMGASIGETVACWSCVMGASA